MNEKRNLPLKTLKIQSFVTSLREDEQKKIYGQGETDPLWMYGPGPTPGANPTEPVDTC